MTTNKVNAVLFHSKSPVVRLPAIRQDNMYIITANPIETNQQKSRTGHCIYRNSGLFKNVDVVSVQQLHTLAD